jgi:hypothetical protein
MDDELVGGNRSTARTSRIRSRATLTGLVIVVALILLVTTKP